MLVSQLLSVGVRDVVLAPGSRSAGLALAVAQAEQSGDLRLHVRIDEREAGFLALGIAKASAGPVAVIVTSGTAVANVLPAVVEAYYSGVALVIVTADRPASSRGRMAPQTINQTGIFSDFVDSYIDLEINPSAQSLERVRKSLLNTRGVRKLPVHINVQCDVPLVPESDDIEWAPEKTRELVPESAEQIPASHIEVPARGVMIIGDVTNPQDAQRAGQLAVQLGWPVLWEPSSNAFSCATAISHGAIMVAHMPVPDAVMTVGTVGLSRSILGLLRNTPEHISIHLPSNAVDEPNPVGTAQRILQEIPSATNVVEPEWLELWRQRSSTVEGIVSAALSGSTLTGPSAARYVWNHASDSNQLVVASSWPVRHVEAYAPCRRGLTVLGNRGANGIDGLISTAWGAALTQSQRTYLLMGDVAFLHGASGLNVSDDIVRPNLTIVVLDNDGGGIFSQLEQGAPDFQKHFEKVFGTPHGRDLWVIAESYGVPATRVTTLPELDRVLHTTDRIPGVHVIVCTTGSRADEFALMNTISKQISQAFA